jgi:anti-sigma B factor antagonist
VGSFAVRSRLAGDLLVVEPEGALDIHTVGALRDAFTQAFGAGRTQLVVLLDGLDFMDSSGLGVLVGGFKSARDRGGSLWLVCTKPFLLRTLRITGLNKVFTVHQSLDSLVRPSGAGPVERQP